MIDVDPLVIGYAGALALFVLLALGIPVGVSMGVIGVVGMVLGAGEALTFGQLRTLPFAVVNNYAFAVLPMFVLMGVLAEAAGLTSQVFHAADLWLRRFRGGLYQAVIVGSAMFAAISGSTIVNAVVFTRIAFPEMMRFGSSKSLSIGSIAGAGSFAAMIPPSITMVIYAIMAEQSVGQLLIAGVIPGVLTAAVYLAGIYLLVRLIPSLAPPIKEQVSPRERWRAAGAVWPIGVLMALVLGGIYTGLFPPSAAGAAGAFGAFCLSVARKRGVRGWLVPTLQDAASISCVIFVILIGGLLLSRMLAVVGVIDDMVAQITTFGTLKAKAAIRDVGRALGLSFAETDAIAKLVPAPKQGFDCPLSEALKQEPRLNRLADEDPRVARLVNHALRLEGLTRHSSTHAAGVVISNRPLVDYLPLYVDRDGGIVTQYDMSSVEKIGLVKFDFLGLKTLTLIHDCLDLVRESRGRAPDLKTLPLDDEEAYRLLGSGDTTGIFQLESTGIREMSVRIKPNCFEDVVAILALYRPGPLDSGMAEEYIKRKSGKEKTTYLHPALGPILKDTYGVIVYQEQVMQIAQTMAKYGLGEADILRRAMGKKDPEEMASQRERFIRGARDNGIREDHATAIFDQMETFARYGFNKSHSAAYALVSYQTAYLKAHYPVEFMAALMSSEIGDIDKVIKNLADCRKQGIEVLPPDVNEGGPRFTVVGDRIRFGLSAVKNVGEKAVESIRETRERTGPFESLFDFCRRVDLNVTNRRVLESLIKCGAFDSTGVFRARLMASLDDALKTGQSSRRDRDSAQIGMFDMLEAPEARDPMDAYRSVDEWSGGQLLAFEKEALGFYITGHPLDRFEESLKRLHALPANRVREHNGEVTMVGVVTALKLKNTRKGDRYANFNLEDKTGFVDTIAWPDTYRQTADSIGGDDPIRVNGRLDVGEERVTLIANEILPLDQACAQVMAAPAAAPPAEVHFYLKEVTRRELQAFHDLIAQEQGHASVFLHMTTDARETKVIGPANFRINPSRTLLDTVHRKFGARITARRGR